MDSAARYEDDIHAWSRHQAHLLRGLAAGATRLPNDLDLDHVAEEIEEVGNEQRFATESNLLQALIHLIRIATLPEDTAIRHWQKEANAFLYNAARRYRPSMRRAIDLPSLWSDASRLAMRDYDIDGLALPRLPRDCPFTLDELTDRIADGRDLAARLAAALPPA